VSGSGAGGGGGAEGQGAPRVAVRWTLSGRVQGVGFRYFVRGMAREVGVVGKVRNLPSGDVEMEVAGHPESVLELKRLVQQGPPGAVVAALREEPLPAAAAWERFEIDR
jgi:acylphosphatase